MLKTYKRKKPGCTLIEGVEELCRLCLGRSDERFPLFNRAEDFNLPLAVRITQCVGLSITEEKNLPNMICKQCHKEIEQFYSFRKRCEVTYQKLKSHQQALKDYALINKAVTALRNNETAANSSAEDKIRLTMSLRNTKETGNMIPCDSISDLLTKTLQELGVISSGPVVEWCDQNIGTVQLDMGDGSQYTFELVEEEPIVHTPTKSVIQNDIEPKQPDVKVALHKIEPQVPVKANSLIIDSKSDSNINNDSRWSCSECEKRFSSQSALRRHARVHSALRPHACQHCGQTFKHKTVCTRHQLLHLPRRPYECASCDRGFSQRGALREHTRLHHERASLRLHACTECPKLFLHPSGLSRHKSQHSGRAFTCSACTRRFTDVSALRRHQLNKHNNTHQIIGIAV